MGLAYLHTLGWLQWSMLCKYAMRGVLGDQSGPPSQGRPQNSRFRPRMDPERPAESLFVRAGRVGLGGESDGGNHGMRNQRT